MTTDDRPIAVFDSGVGGLTVLRALKKRLPAESTIYLGDTARVPYGTRSAQTIIKYAINNVRTLVALADVKMVVVACNTVSAVALPALEQELSIPVVGVITAGARAAQASCQGGRIAVTGTAGTVRSGAYEKALHAAGHRQEVVMRACPMFVPLAEEGWTDGEVPRLVAARYLSDLPADVDTVVLGCTHYPLLLGAIAASLRSTVRIVDSAEATAEDVAALLTPCAKQRVPHHRLLVTDAPAHMARLAPAFLGEQVEVDAVELVDVVISA